MASLITMDACSLQLLASVTVIVYVSGAKFDNDKSKLKLQIKILIIQLDKVVFAFL